MFEVSTLELICKLDLNRVFWGISVTPLSVLGFCILQPNSIPTISKRIILSFLIEDNDLRLDDIALLNIVILPVSPKSKKFTIVECIVIFSSLSQLRLMAVFRLSRWSEGLACSNNQFT